MAVSFFHAMRLRTEDGERDCIDGPLGIDDIAKAARVSVRAAKRAVAAFVAREDTDAKEAAFGAVFAVDAKTVPAPETRTRVEMAAIVAQQIGLGIYRTVPRPAAPPPKKKRETGMATHGHPYKVGTRGRSIRSVEGGRHIATLTCGCGGTHDISFRELAGSQQMDQKFQQAGWSLDPAKCPTCKTTRKDTAKLSAQPSAAAIRSQAAMFNLLNTHFDGEAGTYSGGQTDQKIADAVGLPVAHVAAFRDAAFGPLKVPDEIAALDRDIEALGQLFAEAVAPFQTELDKLRGRAAELRRKFAA